MINRDQFFSYVRSGLKMLGVALVTHGYVSAGNIVSGENAAGVAIAIAGLVWSHYHHDDPPAAATQAPSSPPTPPTLGIFFLLATAAHVGLISLGFGAGCLLSGCAHVQPGSDPLVVRVEQTETAAQSTLSLVLETDQLDRSLWRAQAPGFHSFCESLRIPTEYQVTNTLPRYRVALLTLDDVKLDYQAGKASGSDLTTALTVLQGIETEATAWLNVMTNKPPKL